MALFESPAARACACRIRPFWAAAAAASLGSMPASEAAGYDSNRLGVHEGPLRGSPPPQNAERAALSVSGAMLEAVGGDGDEEGGGGSDLLAGVGGAGLDAHLTAPALLEPAAKLDLGVHRRRGVVAHGELARVGRALEDVEDEPHEVVEHGGHDPAVGPVGGALERRPQHDPRHRLPPLPVEAHVDA